MKKTDYALESFKNIQELIRFIDQKTGAVLVVTGLIFPVYINFVKDLKFVSFFESSFSGIIVFCTSTIVLITLMLILYLSIFKILKPRLAKNYNSNEFSLFYFEHLAELGKEKINIEYSELNEEKKLKYILDQQFEVSKVLTKKIKYLDCLFNILFINILSLGVFIIFSLQL